MKLIIIDGPDNTGKTTVLNHLKDLLINYGGVSPTHIKTIHSVKPKGRTDKSRTQNAYDYNVDLIKNLVNASYANTWDYVFLDRSWISEYVYSQLYRNVNKDAAEDSLLRHERALSLQYNNAHDEIYFIMLTSTDPAFLKNHEDGESLSMQSDNPLDMMYKEIDLFNEAFELSNYAHKIKVNVNAPNNNEFKTFDAVIDEITKEMF